jgi:hypothetical protein
MSSMLVVPARMVGALRLGLDTEMTRAVSELHGVLEEARTPSTRTACREVLARFDRHRVLLDLVGWEEPGARADVRIDLREHGDAVLEALDAELTFAEDRLDEAVREGAGHGASGEPVRHASMRKRVVALRDWVEAVRAQAQL